MHDILTINNPALLSRFFFDQTQEKQKDNYHPWLRPRDVFSGCLRERILGIRNKLSIENSIQPALKSAFDFGKIAHFTLQNDPSYFGDNLIGYWECQACGHKIFGVRPKVNCVKCNAKKEAILYHEFWLKLSGKYKVNCRPDAIHNIDGLGYVIGDIKTIEGDGFFNLDSPKPHDAGQVAFYATLINQSGFPVEVLEDVAFIHYVAKSKARYPYKTFRIDINPATKKLIIESVILFSYYIDNHDKLPKRHGECIDSDMKGRRAKKCIVADICKESKLDSVSYEEAIVYLKKEYDNE